MINFSIDLIGNEVSDGKFHSLISYMGKLDSTSPVPTTKTLFLNCITLKKYIFLFKKQTLTS